MKLKSMRVSPGFQAFVLDQLADVPQVRARAMFGGVGLYAGDVFFGILARDVLYFKTDDSNRAQYEAAGMGPFHPYANKAMAMPYCEVPLAVLESPPELTVWARKSIEIAKQGKGQRAKGKGKGRRGKRT